MRGTIFRSTGSWYQVLGTDGTTYKGRLRGKFKLEGKGNTNPLTVGDHVGFDLEPNAETVVINQIEPRQNYIVRKSVHKTGQGHVIAANLDQAVLIASLYMPRTSAGFIDRFLVSAEAFRIPALIVFNKEDLIDSADALELEAFEHTYKQVGYPTLRTSVTAGTGLSELKALLDGKQSLFSGHSGVGKSSLLNALCPELSLRTGAVSAFANKGTHTTTFAEMFIAWENTTIIDTPGIKEFGMLNTSEAELGHYFPEMRALMNQCKYHNCKHLNEPGCAVKNAVDEGSIAVSRYNSYLSMLSGEDNRK